MKDKSQKAILEVRQKTEEIRAKRIALQQKNDALEDRIREKQVEQDTFRNKMMQVFMNLQTSGHP